MQSLRCKYHVFAEKNVWHPCAIRECDESPSCRPTAGLKLGLGHPDEVEQLRHGDIKGLRDAEKGLEAGDVLPRAEALTLTLAAVECC